MNIKNIKQKKYFNDYKNGYAILFAVMLISIISMIALGLSNTTYKQLIITSVAKDSQVAFYESDMATECGIYLEHNTSILSDSLTSTTWNCGVNSDGSSMLLNVIQTTTGIFDVNFSTVNNNLPCFDININKTDSSGGVIIKSNGYNICDKTNIRTVQRSIQVTY